MAVLLISISCYDMNKIKKVNVNEGVLELYYYWIIKETGYTSNNGRVYFDFFTNLKHA